MKAARVGPTLTSACIIFTGSSILFVLANVFAALRSAPDPERILAGHPVFAPDNEAALVRAYRRPIDEVRAIVRECWQSGSWIYEPYLQFRERPRSGRFVNVAELGFRRNRPEDDRALAGGPDTIFLFGGSTAFGYGVADDETVAAHLEAILRLRHPDRSITVYNFGRGYYGSTQELLLFASLLQRRIVPGTAVFLHGVNEHLSFCPVYSENVAEMFRVAQRDPDARLRAAVGSLPLARLLATGPASGIERFAFDAIRSGGTAFECQPLADADFGTQLAELFRRNHGLIRHLGHAYGVRLLLAVQPVPAYRNRFVDDLFGRPIPDRAPILRLLDSTLESPDEVSLTGALEDFAGDAFVDNVHYSSAGGRRLAEALASELERDETD